jgi:hypothetical protein
MKNINQDEKLYKAFGVLWQPYTNDRGNCWLLEYPLCSNDSCHTILKQHQGGWLCVKCDKTYSTKTNYQVDREHATLMWEGHKTLDWAVYSLELPPTKISGGDEDENYWVQAKLTEKGGKRVAVIYFGEKIRGEQKKTDYAQVFVDLEDEQLRFDRNNKNPMHVLCELTAKFSDSIITQTKNESKDL